MSFRAINLDAFWKLPSSERNQLLNALIFLHDKKTQIDAEKALSLPTPPIITSLPSPIPIATPCKTSNANPPLAPRKKPSRPLSPRDEDSDYEVIVHRVTFDSDDEDEDDSFIIHKKKKVTPSLNLNEK